jgi:hypothetical protein
MPSICLIFVDNNVIWDYFFSLFYTVIFILYLIGLRRNFRHSDYGYSSAPKSIFVGCGFLLFSYLFKSISYLIISGGDGCINLQDDISWNTYKFLHGHVPVFFEISGTILIVIGMLLYQRAMHKTGH